jgi:hypothetical protein
MGGGGGQSWKGWLWKYQLQEFAVEVTFSKGTVRHFIELRSRGGGYATCIRSAAYL